MLTATTISAAAAAALIRSGAVKLPRGGGVAAGCRGPINPCRARLFAGPRNKEDFATRNPTCGFIPQAPAACAYAVILLRAVSTLSIILAGEGETAINLAGRFIDRDKDVDPFPRERRQREKEEEKLSGSVLRDRVEPCIAM
jgi:hypothetical protein